MFCINKIFPTLSFFISFFFLLLYSATKTKSPAGHPLAQAPGADCRDLHTAGTAWTAARRDGTALPSTWFYLCFDTMHYANNRSTKFLVSCWVLHTLQSLCPASSCLVNVVCNDGHSTFGAVWFLSHQQANPQFWVTSEGRWEQLRNGDVALVTWGASSVKGRLTGSLM